MVFYHEVVHKISGVLNFKRPLFKRPRGRLELIPSFCFDALFSTEISLLLLPYASNLAAWPVSFGVLKRWPGRARPIQKS